MRLAMRLVPSAALALVFFACSPTEEDDVLLQGRVRWDLASDAPVDRAFVRVIDSNKSVRCFVTACDGTFVVRRGDVPSLMMPLLAVSVERVDHPEAKPEQTTVVIRRDMEGRVGRERNCNGCHANGVALFDLEPARAELRVPSATCAPGAAPVEIVCPEDRPPPPNPELELVGDFETYSALVHPVLARRCGSMDCHGGAVPSLRIDGDRERSFSAIKARDPSMVMTKARGGASHGGGRVIDLADPADQCVADWLGVARESGGPTSTTTMTHAEACTLAASIP